MDKAHMGRAVPLVLLLCSAGLVMAGVDTTPMLNAALRGPEAGRGSGPDATEVKALPGWSGALPSRIFSGHTSSGPAPDPSKGEAMFHWVFIESESNPETDPVVVWYQGGPGASSLFAMFVESGPFLLTSASFADPKYNETGVPQLVRNEHTWAKLANVLYVDSPPPVGFSYCTAAGQAGRADSCGPWNDATTAQANHRFLTNWFTGDFKAYADHPVYITGESYGGIYVPNLVREFVREAQASPPSTGPAPWRMNLAGFAVGDGCIGTDVLCGKSMGPWYDVEWMHGHGQYSQSLHRAIRAQCPEADLRSGHLSAPCQALVAQMKEEIGGFFAYGLYDECVYEEAFLLADSANRAWYSRMGGAVDAPQSGAGGALNDYACPTNAMTVWLGLPAVRTALHVDVDSAFFSGDNGVGFPYTLSEPNLLPFYHEAITNTSMRVLVYNGDTDPGINSFVTQDIYFDYFASVGLATTKPWRPWTLDGKQAVGGYVIEAEGGFAYLTIRGAGHMVPEYKPRAAYELMRAWLAAEDWKPYTKPPAPPRRSA